MRFSTCDLFRKVYPGLRGYSGPSPLDYSTSHRMDGGTDKQSVRNDEGVSIF